MERELWKDIPGYEGLYQASNLGRIKDIRGKVHKIRKSSVDSNGRLTIGLNKNGKRKTCKTSSLIALTFIGNRPKGYDVCHLDGDKLNNNINNLSYDTRSQNMRDMYRQGGKVGRGKLTTIEICFIRHLYKTGKFNFLKLSKIFEVRECHIRDIVNKKIYNWINDDGTIEESRTIKKLI